MSTIITMHRRDFLDPRRLAETAGHVIGLADVHVDLTAPSSQHIDAEITLVRYSRPAMGTVFEIVLPFGHGVPTSTIHEALDLIDELEEQLTIYRTTSEVSELNRRGFGEAVQVTPTLFELLELSQQLSRETNGAFDITTGALVEAWGFVRGPKRVPTEDERERALARCGWKHLQLQFPPPRVRYAVEGLSINLGSIGKGYALDQVAGFFRSRCPGQSVLLHGGKSSVIGIGCPPGHSKGWSVGIEHPWIPDTRLTTIYLQDQAMATSAATFKHLVHEGRKLGHILDPRTGWPTLGTASATAIAFTAAVADALSTAFYIMGAEEAAKYCQTHREVEAMILPEGAKEALTIRYSV
ncbi:MAG TPA: FAD:protein FMN transferase [Gemmatales bacterium]|nr:FAD:protein FMN transferase [Gemmatales bacterium]